MVGDLNGFFGLDALLLRNLSKSIFIYIIEIDHNLIE